MTSFKDRHNLSRQLDMPVTQMLNFFKKGCEIYRYFMDLKAIFLMVVQDELLIVLNR